MAVSIQPQAGYVVAQQKEAEAKTASGFYLPEQAKEKPAEAVVVAVGKNVDGLKAGDKIIYKNSYEATEVKHGAQTYLIIEHKNIVATVK
ncbi:co-chaperone GroES [Candidatus Saccharibacteria bacterium]|nr:co-chaperone GroES [Candidatus Saccharibacteria bacterium]